MIHSFDYLVQQVLAQTDERGDTDSSLALVKEYLNAAHQLRCSEMAEHFLVMDATLTTTLNVQDYSLHHLFDKPIYFWNRVTLEFLTETPSIAVENEGWSMSSTTGPLMTGTAKDFCFWGHAPVKNQPTSASVITVVSNNNADIGSAYQVVVKGVDSSEAVVADLITPNGTAPVAGAISFTKILAITKAGPTAGTLTFTSNSGTVTNVSLSPNELGRQYRQIHLLEAPSASETIEYRFYRKPLYLVNSYDIPDIPYPYSQLLVYDALLNFAAYNTDLDISNRVQIWRAQQQQWEASLRNAYKNSQTIGARSRYTRTVGSNWLGEEI